MQYRQKKYTSRFQQQLESIPREYLVIIFFVLFTLYIISSSFSYTILNYNFYKTLADKQQIGEIEVPVTRGNIYASSAIDPKQKPILATSVELMDIAIDPQMVWDTQKLKDFLTDILYLEMCENHSNETCYKKMLRFLKKSEIPAFSFSPQAVKSRISQRLEERLSQTRVTSVLIKENLSPDDEKELLSWRIAWLYPSVNGVYVNPEEIIEKERFLETYSQYFSQKKDELEYKIRKRDLRYIAIYQKLSLTSSDEVRYFLREEKKAVEQWIITEEESIGNFFVFDTRTQRIYSEHTTASQVIGFIDNEGVWHYGIEWYFHNELKWDPWALVGKKDVRGRPIDPISLGEENNSSQEWVDIYTSIDRNIQKMAEDIIHDGVIRYWANKGSIVVMEPKTWRILALANYPKYDPHTPWEVYTLQKVTPENTPRPETDLLWKIVFVEDLAAWDSLYFEGKEIFLREALREEYADDTLQKYIYTNGYGPWVYRNDTVSSLYEPGSILKPLTVAIGIDTNEITAYERYQDVGKLTIDNFTIENDSDTCLWYHTFTHALSYSCNVWMIRIVQRVWKSLFHKYLHDFWFWDLSGIQLDGEVFWKIEAHERWSTAKLLTSSYGLGVSVTPLQMAAAYSVLANGWVYMRPYIVDKIVSPNGKTQEYSPQKIRRVLHEETANTVTSMLVAWVNDGAARNAKVAWYAVAGKTWTAQIAYRWKYEEWVASTYASFAWYAPAEDPLFVIVVKLERPRQNQYGGHTAAYLFSELTQKLLDYYQIPKKEEQ